MFKKLKTITSALIVFILSFGLITPVSVNAKEDQKEISIYLAGDSTVSNYDSNLAPRAGWGQVIKKYFNKNVNVKNCAISGRSSKSFIDEGHLDEILNEIQSGDYLFIQFGHNDEKSNDSTRYTDPETTYKSYLKQYIDGAKAHNAIPVLVTPVARRKFDADGNIISTHGKYPQAMKELAQSENVAIIDLTTLSESYFQNLGPEKTKNIFLHLDPGASTNYPNGVSDDTHFQENGASKVAKLIIKEIRKSDLDLKDYTK